MGNVHFSSQSMEWATPWPLFNSLAKKYGPFTLDVCASPDNAKCKNFYSLQDDALSKNWKGICWMNPPYGREIHKWVAYAWQEACLENNAKRVVCLVPARTDTGWWHDYVIKQALSIEFIRGRIKFGGAVHNAPFPSAVVVFA